VEKYEEGNADLRVRKARHNVSKAAHGKNTCSKAFNALHGITIAAQDHEGHGCTGSPWLHGIRKGCTIERGIQNSSEIRIVYRQRADRTPLQQARYMFIMLNNTAHTDYIKDGFQKSIVFDANVYELQPRMGF
jgi:hypothetical protein